MELILYGIFNRNDLFVGGVDLIQGTVQRGGLSASGWAGYQNDTMGTGDKIFKSLKVFLGKPK